MLFLGFISGYISREIDPNLKKSRFTNKCPDIEYGTLICFHYSICHLGVVGSTAKYSCRVWESVASQANTSLAQLVAQHLSNTLLGTC